MSREVKKFTDSTGKKGKLGDWVVNLETQEVITVQRITTHGGFHGTTLHAVDPFGKEYYTKAKTSTIIRQA